MPVNHRHGIYAGRSAQENKKTNEETQIIIRKKWRENKKKFLIWEKGIF